MLGLHLTLAICVVIRKGGRGEERGGASFIYTADDVVSGKGEPNGFWEYGGCCLGNRCIGCTVTYVMSQVSEVLVPT